MRHAAALVGLGFLLALPARAADAPPPSAPPWEKPFASDTSAILAAANAGERPKKDAAETLLDDTRIFFEPDGRLTRIHRTVRRLLTHAAIEMYGTARAWWSPWYETKPEIRARVITPDGASFDLDQSVVTEGSVEQDALLLDDRRTLNAPLPKVSEGAILEVETVTHETALFFEAGRTEREPLGAWRSTRRIRLTVDAPDSLSLKIETRGTDAKPQVTTGGGRTVRVWETGPFKRRRWDRELPPDVAAGPEVQWSTARSWNAVASRYAAIVDERIAGSAPLLTPAPTGTKREIAEALLAALQKRVRYTGLELGVASLVPATPNTTLERGFGDCKDKASVLVAALRGAGIDAHVALLYASTGEDVRESLPGMGMFNHAIVYAGGKDPFWIDPTVETTRVGLLPAEDQGRLALVADAKTKSLTRTPITPSKESISRFSERDTLASWGGGDADVEIRADGPMELSERSRALHSEPSEREKSWSRWARQQFGKKAELTLPDAHDAGKPWVTRITATKTGRASTRDADAWITLNPSYPFAQLPWDLRYLPAKERKNHRASDDDDDDPRDDEDDDGPKRTAPFWLYEPYTAEARTEAALPPGFVTRSVPPDETRTIGTLTWSAHYAVAGTSFTATFHLDTGAGPFTPAQAREIAELATTVSERSSLVWFDRKSSLDMKKGAIADAIHGLRDAVAAHPQDGDLRATLARSWLAAGFGEEARAEAARAVAVSPSSAYCAWVRGFTFESDLLGRNLARGANLAEAERAFRRGMEVEDGKEVVASSLGALLELTPDGSQWASGSRLDEAIAILEAERKDSTRADANSDATLYGALLHAGKSARVLELIGERPRSSGEEMYRIAARALEGGPQAAADEASSYSKADATQARYGAIYLLLDLRRYPDAIAVARNDEGPRNLSDPSGNWIEMMRKTRRVEDLHLDPGDPAGLAKLALAALVRDDPEASTRYFTAENADEVKLAVRGLRDILLGVAKHNPATARFLVTYVADLLASASETTVEAGHGAWKVDVRIEGAPPVTFYEVKTPAGLRVFAGSLEQERLGLAARSALDKKDLAAARQWLDWAGLEDRTTGDMSTFRGTPFAHLWTGVGSPSADDMRLAASLLIARSKKDVSTALPALEAARKTASARTQVQLDRALVSAYLLAERPADALPIATALADRFPDEATAFALRVFSLSALKRFPEAEELVTKRMQDVGEDVSLRSMLAGLHESEGDIAGAEAILRKSADAGNATTGNWNEIAWDALFLPPVTDQAERDARRAIDGTHGRDASSLHTLACVEAELGKLGEARDLLFRAMDARHVDEPSNEDWYAWGRIAEQLGLPETARADYAKVEKKGDSPVSTWNLAQRRLQALGSARR